MVLPPSTKVGACAREPWAEDGAQNMAEGLEDSEACQRSYPVAFPTRIALSAALHPVKWTIRLTARVSSAQLRQGPAVQSPFRALYTQKSHYYEVSISAGRESSKIQFLL